VPWCSACDRFLSPSTVTTTGTCPRCGGTVDPGRARGTPSASVAEDDDAPLPLPWHFKMLVGALVLYLGWRAYEGVEWLVHQV
jgi:hypothetical protein